MRLFEIETRTSDDYEISPEKVIHFIKKNCQPWLSETNNGQLVVYRGLRNYPRQEVFVKKIRKDRRPQDTRKEWTEVLNYVIDEVGGVANRTNSAFVYPRYSLAWDYGKPRVFIPVGDFHFTWSPVWNDWWANLFEFRGWVDLFETELIDELKTTDPKFVDPKDFDWISFLRPKNELKDMVRTDDNLQVAIESGNEIMIAARKGLYIDRDFYEEHIVVPLGTKQ